MKDSLHHTPPVPRPRAHGGLLAGLALAVLSVSASAQSLITNGSFENYVLTGTESNGGGFLYGSGAGGTTLPANPVGGWDFQPETGMITENHASGGFQGPQRAAADGNQYIFLQTKSNVTDSGPPDFDMTVTPIPTYVATSAAISFTAGQVYELSFYQASRTNGGGAASYQVRLSNGDVLFSRTTSSSESWTQYTASYTATSTGNYTFQFYLPGASGDNTVFFDNVSLTTTASAVPEPSTYAAIFGALALGSVAVIRRRRAAAIGQN